MADRGDAPPPSPKANKGRRNSSAGLSPMPGTSSAGGSASGSAGTPPASPRAAAGAPAELSPMVVPAQRTRTFYKLVSQPTLFPHNSPMMGQWDGIQRTGLDPSQAGQNPLGATSTAKASSRREETELDRNQTWLTDSKGGAYAYRSHIKNPRMLRIDVSAEWAERHVVDRGDAGFTTDRPIPPASMSVKTAHADGGTSSVYTPLQDLRKQHFTGYDSDEEYDSDDEA